MEIRGGFWPSGIGRLVLIQGPTRDPGSWVTLDPSDREKNVRNLLQQQPNGLGTISCPSWASIR
jgi:hypothetical protein